MDTGAGRVFLFLQGPHGPFFHRLATRLTATGAEVRCITFNPAGEAEWAGAGPLERYLGARAAYPGWIAAQLETHQVTDVVLYGDSRPEHARAIEAARARGILCHCLEEGYLRPHRVTYERWGNNGNSPLLEISLARMIEAVGAATPLASLPEDGWGAQGPHLGYSALHHARLLLPSRRYGAYRSHRDHTLWREIGHYLRRIASFPLRRAVQASRARWLRAGDRRYHLVLLQLSFDTSMRVHSHFRTSAQFVGDCIDAFARGGAPEDHLVFKSHPFEDGREALGRVIARSAKLHGVAHRVLFLDGGPTLASLLDGAKSAVTINSTAAQQALWRGLPVAALGRAVYAKPGLVSGQRLDRFFAHPLRPNQQAYWVFRRFLLQTSQFEGSLYSKSGISALLDYLPAAMLDPLDPYERVLSAAFTHAPVAVPAADFLPSRPPVLSESREVPHYRRIAV